MSLIPAADVSKSPLIDVDVLDQIVDFRPRSESDWGRAQVAALLGVGHARVTPRRNPVGPNGKPSHFSWYID